MIPVANKREKRSKNQNKPGSKYESDKNSINSLYPDCGKLVPAYKSMGS